MNPDNSDAYVEEYRVERYNYGEMYLQVGYMRGRNDDSGAKERLVKHKGKKEVHHRWDEKDRLNGKHEKEPGTEKVYLHPALHAEENCHPPTLGGKLGTKGRVGLGRVCCL